MRLCVRVYIYNDNNNINPGHKTLNRRGKVIKSQMAGKRKTPCCSKGEGLNRGAWKAVEDKILTDYIKAYGEGKWRHIPKAAGRDDQTFMKRTFFNLFICTFRFDSFFFFTLLTQVLARDKKKSKNSASICT